MTGLVRLGGTAALVGGVLRIGAAFIAYTPGSPWLEGLYAVIDANLLLGLIGIYLSANTKLGGLGLAGFVIAVIGLGSIIGPDGVQFGIDFYLVGSLTLLGGLVLWSVALLRGRVMRPVAALWLASAGLTGTVTVIGNMAVLAAGTALGAAFAYAGAAIIAGRSAPAVAD